MTKWKHTVRSGRLGLLLAITIALPATIFAEQLPLKTYTIANGLARDYINRIVLDSRGFLWFCTPEGLSRFDGYVFTNYGSADGLQGSVRDLLEARDGAYWIATAAGLYRFDPTTSSQLKLAPTGRSTTPSPKFQLYRPGDKQADGINILRQDHSGVIWCGTEAGLYRLDQVQGSWRFSFVDIGLRVENPYLMGISALLEDSRGSLWIGTGYGLFRRLPDGSVERYTAENGLPNDNVQALLEDQGGRVWIGTSIGLSQSIPDGGQRGPIRIRTFKVESALAGVWVSSLLQSNDGHLWVGTTTGLYESRWSPDQGGLRFRRYTTTAGLAGNEIQALAEDRDNNLWMGTESSGVMKLARNGFASYTEADGLRNTRIASIFEDRAGELCVISKGAGEFFIHRFNGGSFDVATPNPGRRTSYGWGWNQIAFQDSHGEWWVPTTQGLYRFPATSQVEQLSHLRPKTIYTTREGLPNNEIFRLYEDSRGDIWITTTGTNLDSFTKWERESGRFKRYDTGQTLGNGPSSFREDRFGNLWIGFYMGGLVRHRDGKFTLITAADGLPEGIIRDLFLDHSGNLWIATGRGGVARAENLDDARPRITSYTTADGLASNQATCVTEDQQGRIYIGTPKGVDRLNPATGQFKHYSTAEGLANNFVNVAYRDHQGSLWFGTLQGLSRLLPEPERSSAPPPIFINRLRIAGEDYSVSPLGQAEIAGPELSTDQNDLQIDYAGVSVSAADSLRYQYKLEGVDRDWSAPTTQRSITYARLSPAAYRFLVRAISTDGIASAPPAFVSFTIMRPVWQRWWFLSLIGFLVAGVAYVVHKYRVNQLLELERVRTRIATDLHDDIGASLSQIAILSEVASQKIELGDHRVKEPLKLIAGNSRELVDSMSDIVWAINPKRDRVRDLSQRVRRFASDMFTARNIDLQFHAPNERQDLKVGTDVRRQVFLIFKESVNNAVRHSGCTRAEVDLSIDGNTLTLRVSDNGKGFRENGESSGHGLASMRERAIELGGSLEIASADGDGTTVLLRIPIDGHHLWRRSKVAT